MTLIFVRVCDANHMAELCRLAKTSYTRKMNDLAQSSIRAFPLSSLP